MIELNRSSKTKKRKAFISIALVLALAITGALAFLTARDSAENKFTVGNVDIELTEPSWDENNAKDIVSGQVIAKDPTITNTGKNDAYVYMMVEIPKDTKTTEDFYPLFSFTANEGWTLIDSKLNDDSDANDYYLYAHSKSLAPGMAATLFNEVTFANVSSDFIDTYAQDGISSFDIKVTGYAIQSDYYNNEAADAGSAWMLYVNQNGWQWPIVPAENHVAHLNYRNSRISYYVYGNPANEFEVSAPQSTENNIESLGWIAQNGHFYSSQSTATAEELFIRNTQDEILNINPTLKEVVKYSNPDEGADKVMLVPNYNATVWSESNPCPTVIDRGGQSVDDYEAGVSEWCVYGLKTRLKSTDLLNYITVQGEGRMEIEYIKSYDENGNPIYTKNPDEAMFATSDRVYTGTGTIINVYRNDNNELVESLKIVIFGDTNGDSNINATDASMVSDEADGVTSWSNKESTSYDFAKVRAIDFGGDKKIDKIDKEVVTSHAVSILIIDQIRGYIK